MAPVRRLRSLAWINARRLPGVRCSTLKTACRSLLCLIIIPGRNWVAGIDIPNFSSMIWVFAGWPRAQREAEANTILYLIHASFTRTADWCLDISFSRDNIAHSQVF